MPYVSPNVQDEPEKSQYILGFPRGLNTIQDKTLVNDKNLTQADNVMTVVDGLTRRYGSTKVYDEASATKIYGAGAFYKKTDGTKKFVRIGNANLQYLNGSNWSAVSAQVYTNTRTSFVQVYNRLYIHNGTDPLTYYDGSSITTYSALTSPTNLAVTPTYKEIVNVSSITRSGSTATCTTASAHGKATGDWVTISGAGQAEYNIRAQITVVSTTVFTYTVSGTPATPATGTILCTTDGAESYAYRVSAFNATGETAACARVTTSTGPKTLSATNYNALSWTAVGSATGYNIYGRTSTGTQEVYLATVYTASYNDTGVDVPVTSKLVQEINTTTGIKAKKGIFTLGRQFCIGVTEGSTYYPTRLYYSGTVQYIDSFSSAEYGGGWVEIYANDGGEIVDIQPFQTGVLVFKNNGLFYFYFTSTGYPAIKDITRSHGGCAIYGSQSVENNILFVGQMENRIGAWTAGTQANYGSDEIRTNEVSLFISNSFTDINRTYLSNICTFYYDNKFGFSYTRGSNTENDIGYVFDTRFGGWSKWDGDPVKVTQYVIYDDGANAYLYGCSNSDGYMIQMMKSTRNDNGSAFRSVVGTKFYNQELFDTEKIYRNPTLWFKYITGGTISAEVWTDGVSYLGSASLSSTSGGAGMGVDLAGSILPGDTYSEVVAQSASADVVKELSLTKLARNLGIYLIDNTVNSNWIFMGLHLLYTPLVGKPVSSTEKVALSS